jgi:hypothetical protein
MQFTPSRIVMESDVMSSDVGEGVIAMKMGTDEVFNMDAVAREFWNGLGLLDGDVFAAAQTILSKYDVAPSMLYADLQELLNGLIKAGLVRAATP